MQIKSEYPAHLLVYPSRLAFDSKISSFLLKDEYVFSTYLCTLLQGFRFEEQGGDDENVLAAILQESVPNYSYSAADNEVTLDLDKQERLMKFVEQLRLQFNEQVTTTYVKDFLLATSVYRGMMGTKSNFTKAQKQLGLIVSKMMEVIFKRQQGVSSITFNLDRLMNVIDMTMAETRLLEMNYLFSTDIRALIFRDTLFLLGKDSSMFEHVYRVMLGKDEACDEASIDEAISESSKPIALGIVSYDAKTKKIGRLSEFWAYAISHFAEDDDKFYSRFVFEIKEKKRTFSGAIAKILPSDEALFNDFIVSSMRISESSQVQDRLEFLKKETAIPEVIKIVDETLGSEQSILEKNLSKGMNCLLYGINRLDKLGYVTEVLKKKEIPGYQVSIRDAKAGDIPAICYVAQQYLFQSKPGSILIIDKTEKALTRTSSRPAWYDDMFGEDDPRRGTIDDLESDELLLIKNPVPTIWLTNTPAGITPENVGRFLFHAELKGGSRKDRRDEVDKVIAELGFSPEISQKLSKYLELNVEQIKSAGKMVQMLGRDGVDGEDTLLHLIANSQKALDRNKEEQIRSSVTKYNLDLLNIGGGISIERIIEALKKRPKGGLCLFGPPGTGKTQLAEHIAVQLDMPLLIKPASELLSMYIGESEKNIAKAFQEAKDEGAIFLLDEADSFLRDRAMASRSWEVTQVNELLMRMERFCESGIFICATNLMNAVDAAALRRFTFKLEFRALTFEQRFKMLSNECELVEKLSDAEKMDLQIDLQLIKHLTPGDFAVVKRQAVLMDEELTIKNWLDRLTIESKAKMIGIERNSYSSSAEQGGEVIPTHRPAKTEA